MEKQWTIRKDSDRYPGFDDKLPSLIHCFGTYSQAEELAFRLSSWYPGCDYIFYVVEDE